MTYQKVRLAGGCLVYKYKNHFFVKFPSFFYPKKMRRTENMKFTNLSDYDYSEGETSEDMKNQSNSLSRGGFPKKFIFNKPAFV